VDPQDEDEEPRWERPPLVRGGARAVRDRGRRLRDSLAGLEGRAQSWDAGHRRTDFVSSAETVMIDERRHVFLLVTPALRTVAGLGVLAAGPALALVLPFAALTLGWTQVRHSSGFRSSLLVTASAVAALVVLDALVGSVLLALLLLGWLAEDVTDWFTDRLVVTDKRIYRRYGVLTRHSPSIALTAIAFVDAAVPPVGRLLHYGTLRLDSVAQRDAPLSRFDLIPDVVPVSHEILRLRTLAMPKYQQPY
jgi:hypothetical protein